MQDRTVRCTRSCLRDWRRELIGTFIRVRKLGLTVSAKRCEADGLNIDRLSGLWGGQTSLGIFLEESQTTTLFIGGVNRYVSPGTLSCRDSGGADSHYSDQCVFSTFVDAFSKGYDVVYVEDCSATTTPSFGDEMVRHNADGYGFIANSTDVIEALGKRR